MSLIGLLLGRTKLPQWALELIVIASLAGGFWWYHHHVYAQGIAAQQAADNKASAPLIAQANIETKANQAAADAAHDAWMRRISDEKAAVASVPLPTVRMCIDSYDSGPGVSQAGTTHPGNASTGAPAAGVPQVPRGNPGLRGGQGPDISGLLELLARRGDGVSSELAEYKARQP